MRIKQIKGRVLKLAKMEEAQGTLALDQKITLVEHYQELGLWLGLSGSSATSKILIGDIHDGAPRLLRKLSDGRGATSFVVDRGRGEIVVGNGDGTVTIWGVEK